MKRGSFIAAAVIILILIIGQAYALAPEVQSGLGYLTSTQNADGSWGSASSSTDPVPATASVIETLAVIEGSPSSIYDSAAGWLGSQSLETTAHLSERMLALSPAGSDLSMVLSYADGVNRAWGGYEDYDINVLDTALALMALTRAEYSDQTVITYAIGHLLNSQNADGGWGFYTGYDSNTYVTAMAVLSLKPFAHYTQVATALNKAEDHLLSHQNADGGFGSSPSTVYDTALAYLVLAGDITDQSVLGGAVDYLKANQAADGSWEQDPYSTALAMRALYLAQNSAEGPADPTTGSVTGRVVDAASGQPLGGVSVTVQGTTTAYTSTDTTGAFELTGIDAGSVTLEFSLNGYATQTASAQISPGSVLDVGTVLLSVSPTTGIITGTVTDADSGLPISGAEVAVTGSYTGSVTTDASGRFTIANVTPGAVDITVSMEGYYSASGQGTVNAGGTLVFSPGLTPMPAEGGTGTITGIVADASTGLPISGVTITLESDAGISTTSGANGEFTLDGVPSGTKVIVFSYEGYAQAEVTVGVSASGMVDIGTITLASNPTTGTVRGIAAEAGTGTPLEGVTVTVAGLSTATAVTAADGTFTFNDVTPGTTTITAEKDGYITVTQSADVVAGGTVIFSPAMVSSTGTLRGGVLDASTGEAVAGATVSVSDIASATTDSQGGFLIDGLEPGTYIVDISATGYLGQQYQIVIIAGAAVDLDGVSLTPVLESTTITGVVTDASTGDPIEGADVTVVESGLSTTTGPDGSYSIAGIDLLEFSVRASSTGYNGVTQKLVASDHGSYKADFALSPSRISGLTVTSLNTAKSTYGSHETVSITAVITNEGAENELGTVVAEIVNPDGEVLGVIAPLAPDLALAQGQSVQKELKWETVQAEPGRYKIVLVVIEPMSIGYANPRGTILAERQMFFDIQPTPSLGGSISLDPPVTQADLQVPINIKAAVRNTGNVPLSTDLVLEVSHDGTVVYSHEAAISELDINNVRTFELGYFVPQGDGTYTVSLSPTEAEIASDITKELFVGKHARATFTVTPQEAYAGEVKVTGNLYIEGAGILNGTTEDPLVPIIKEAIQKGVDYEQPAVMSWNNYHKCNGCHIQTQALVGLELSRDHADMDTDVNQYLFELLKSWQKSSGEIGGAYTNQWYPRSQTFLGLWAYIYWHDQSEAKPYIIKSANYMLGWQNSDGSWSSDHENPRGWWMPDVSATAVTMLGVSQAYIASEDPKFYDPLINATQYLVPASRVQSSRNMEMAHKVIGLESVINILEDSELKDQASAAIDETIDILKSNQRQDGGWGRYTYNGSDSLITAQVLYAMLRGGIDKDDPAVKKAIEFLLNSQAANGSWESQNRVLSTRLAATTWVMISLPIALDELHGIEAEITLDFPQDVSVNSSSPLHQTHEGSVYKWNMPGIDENGKNIELALELSNLAVGEERAVANDAYLTFVDEFTNTEVKVPISIPTVTGVAPIGLDVNTDKPEYTSFEDAAIDVNITNLSSLVRSADVHVAIEDASGYEVAVLGDMKLVLSDMTFEELEPVLLEGWNYIMPVTITPSAYILDSVARTRIDFDQIFSELDIEDKHIDTNSIRVLEYDESMGNAEAKEMKVEFDSSTAIVSWLLDGFTEAGETRKFYIHFDILENGEKEPVENSNLNVGKGLLAYADEQGRTYTVESLGDGTFVNAQFRQDIGSYTRGIVLADFTNDGYPDYITGYGSGTGYLHFFRNKGDGSNDFNRGYDFTKVYGNNWIMDMAAGDFNNDGNSDFIMSKDDDRLFMFLGNGNATFSRISLESPGDEIQFRGKTATDIDGDWDIDLIVAAVPGKIYLYSNNGDGTFAPAELIADIGYNPYGLASGDFDNDGKIDIISNQGDEGDAYFLKGNGDGTFSAPVNIASLDTGESNAYAAFDAGDLNNDGKLDIVAAIRSEKAIYFYPGNGDGTFGERTFIASASYETLAISAPWQPDLYMDVGSPLTLLWELDFIWNTESTYAGDYRVHAIASEEDGTVSHGYANFRILPDVTLDSKVATDKISYNSNEPVEITSNISSLGSNYIFEDLDAEVSISNPDGNVLYSNIYPIAMIAPGQQLEIKTYWDTAQNAAGIYSVTLKVLQGANILDTAAADFEILATQTTGKGMVGSISAQPDPVKKGNDETFAYMIQNDGNEDIDDLDVKVIIIDPLTEEVVKVFEDIVDLPEGVMLTGSFTDSTTGLAQGTYIAVLVVQAPQMDEPRSLASDTFTVEAPAVEVYKNITDYKNVLVWLNYPWQSGKDCPDVSLIESALQAIGVDYVIVYDKKDFQTELRNPFYTDYMILGDHHPIEGHFSDELMQHVFAGKGLISSMFNRENLDENVFGIKFEGYLKHGDYPVELLESDISSEGLFNATGRSLRVEVTTPEEVVARIVQTTKKGEERHPAIVQRSYGLGNVLFYAFDLGLSSKDYDWFESMLANSLYYVHKSIAGGAYLSPNDLVPVKVTLKSLGDAVDVRLEEIIPSGIVLYDPNSGTWIENSPWTLDVHLEAGEVKSILYYALLPDTTDTFMLRSRVGYVEGGSYSYILDSDLELSVRSTADIAADIIQTLEQLSVSAEDSIFVSDALMYIQNVQSRVVLTQENIEENINDIIYATDSILLVTSTDTTDVILTMDRLLESWENAWYFSLQ